MCGRESAAEASATRNTLAFLGCSRCNPIAAWQLCRQGLEQVSRAQYHVTLLPGHRPCCPASDTPVPPKEAPAVQGPPASLQGPVLFLEVCSSSVWGLSPPPRGPLQPPPQVASVLDFAAVAPISPGPHPYWLGYVHSVCRRAGGVRIHMGYRSYIHCAYIYVYIYSIYIYLFTFIYILYRTFTFYQRTVL